MSGFTTPDVFPSVLGGGIPGGQPKGGLLGGGAYGRYGGSGMEGGNERGLNRTFLRRVLNFRVFPDVPANAGITPFRRLMNAGDSAGTVNSGPSPALGRPINQLSSMSMLSRLHINYGSPHVGQSMFTGNQRFVYDGSDYVRFKKLIAENKNYNDSSFGGDAHNASQSALRRVRRG